MKKNIIDGLLLITLLALSLKTFFMPSGIPESLMLFALGGLLGFRSYLAQIAKPDYNQEFQDALANLTEVQEGINRDKDERLKKLEGTVGSLNLTKFQQTGSGKNQFGW